jgi:penicillin-binding protein 1A
MKEALADQPPTPFRVPPGIDLVPVDAHTGALVAPGSPGAIDEAFKSGTEPGLASADDTTQPTQRTDKKSGSAVDQGTGGLY